MQPRARALFLMSVSAAWMACAIPLAAQSDKPATVRAYDISAQPLAQALSLYSEQTGVKVVFDPALIADKQNAELHGGYTPDAALSSLLRGTGLIAVKEANGDVRVVRDPGSAATPQNKEPAKTPPAPSGRTEKPATTAAAVKPSQEWPGFGYDAGDSRFSPLKQITPANVAKLKLAWSYNLRPEGVPKPDLAQLRDQAQVRRRMQNIVESGPPVPPAWALAAPPVPSSGSEFTPIVVNGTMFFGSPFGRVVALDAATGREKWALVLPKDEQTAPRGLAYWPGDAKHTPRLVVTLRSNKVFTVDVASGKINSRFGNNGILDLRTPDVMGNFPRGILGANGVPVVYRNLMILGSRGQEFPRKGPRGDVRAFDVVTGALVWKFNAIPEPGEPNFGTWDGESWRDRAGVNIWNAPTVDEARGIVYLPFGAPAYDREGTDRAGMGLYGTSLVAVNARTGKYLWHFQTVHHDIWDIDMPAPPTLIDVKRGGKTIPAVAAITKTSLLFILDRVTGKPLFEVKEVPVPASELPGEKAWPTQPIPVKPEPLARESIDLATEIADVTPAHTARCKKMVADLKMSGTVRYEPIGYNKPTVHFPGIFGGVDWGGGAFDKANGLYIVNITNQGSVQMLRKAPDGSVESGTTALFWFSDMTEGVMPCQKTPWGELIAVDVSAGKVAWRVPLGVTDTLPKEKQNTGRPMMGGPIVTAGGLIFVAATDDERFRAFNSKTGELLWETKLDAAGHATPLTYLAKDGKQYVTLMATGGSYLNSPSTSDNLVTYALP